MNLTIADLIKILKKNIIFFFTILTLALIAYPVYFNFFEKKKHRLNIEIKNTGAYMDHVIKLYDPDNTKLGYSRLMDIILQQQLLKISSNLSYKKICENIANNNNSTNDNKTTIFQCSFTFPSKSSAEIELKRLTDEIKNITKQSLEETEKMFKNYFNNKNDKVALELIESEVQTTINKLQTKLDLTDEYERKFISLKINTFKKILEYYRDLGMEEMNAFINEKKKNNRYVVASKIEQLKFNNEFYLISFIAIIIFYLFFLIIVNEKKN